MKLGRLAKVLAADVNVKRRAKGLLSRPVGSSHQVKTNVKPYLFTFFSVSYLPATLLSYICLVLLKNFKRIFALINFYLPTY